MFPPASPSAAPASSAVSPVPPPTATGGAAQPAGAAPECTPEHASRPAVLAGLPPRPDADLLARVVALGPSATLFYTPFGRELVRGIAVRQGHAALMAHPQVDSAGLRGQVAAEVERLQALPGRAVLLLGGGHGMPGTLPLFHAALDAYRRHGLPLLLEIHPSDWVRFEGYVDLLTSLPHLRWLLGRHAMHSREGQRIVWDYVRGSGERGALQRQLPETLAYLEIRRTGVPLRHIDPLGPDFAEGRRNSAMALGIQQALRDHDKAIVLLGMGHCDAVRRRLHFLGTDSLDFLVLDEAGNDLRRLFDVPDADFEPDAMDLNAGALANNRALPGNALPATQSRICRTAADMDPFDRTPAAADAAARAIWR